MLIALLSAKGSPGVTTAALALGAVWPRPSVVVDADPFGGDVRAGIGRGGWPADSGIAELVIDLRTSTVADSLAWRAHRPGEHAPAVLAGIASITQAAGLPWALLGPELAGLAGLDCITDCGRFVPGVVDELLRVCDALVLVTGSTLREVRAASRVAPAVAERGHLAGMVVSRPGHPYGAAEIAQSCGLALLGELADDARTAAIWSEGDRPVRSLLRSEFMRGVDLIAGRLAHEPAHRWTP
ncbi:MAG: hypothetical protein L0H84_04255 [Pseudonocardia sp.]|nr:hypothetical protein [Pseudonocardia sp.]